MSATTTPTAPAAPKSGKDMRLVAEIALDFPIEVSGVKTAAISMRRPKARDELIAQERGGSQGRMALRILEGLTGIDEEALLELDAGDFEKLERQYMAFKGASPSAS